MEANVVRPAFLKPKKPPNDVRQVLVEQQSRPRSSGRVFRGKKRRKRCDEHFLGAKNRLRELLKIFLRLENPANAMGRRHICRIAPAK